MSRLRTQSYYFRKRVTEVWWYPWVSIPLFICGALPSWIYKENDWSV